MDYLLIGSAIGGLLFFLAAVLKFERYRQRKQLLQRHLQHCATPFVANTQTHQSLNTKSALGAKQTNTATRVLIDRFLHWAGRCSALGTKIPFPHTHTELDILLERAGLAPRLPPQTFLGLKVLLALLGVAVGGSALAVHVPLSQFGLLLLPLVGFMGPVVWLNLVVRKRQASISAAMPDYLDVMSITLQAGMSLDNALQQTGGIFHGALQEEMFRLEREMELGVDRDTAWRRLMDRNSAPELQQLGKEVLQGASLGVPLSEIFRMQADHGRQLRSERAKQKAAKASPAITLVTTLIMAPAVFVMILGLLLLNVFYNPQGLGIEGFFK